MVNFAQTSSTVLQDWVVQNLRGKTTISLQPNGGRGSSKSHYIEPRSMHDQADPGIGEEPVGKLHIYRYGLGL